MSNAYPTLYAALLDRGLDKPMPEWNLAVAANVASITDALSRLGEDAMRQAYTAGLRDGFQQGIEAESARHAGAVSRGES